MKKRVILKVSGMHCHNCCEKINSTVSKMEVEDLKISYEKGQLTCLADNREAIIEVIEKMGYSAEVIKDNKEQKKSYGSILVGFIIFIGLYMVIKNTVGFKGIPDLQEQVSYPILFVLGTVTSLHCLSMCGGIVLSQSIAFQNPVKSSFLYNVGRVISYTVIGGIVGGIGSVVSFSGELKGYITIFAGGFMILLGLSMLEPFQFLKRYTKLPRFLSISKLNQNCKTPLFIGLATGIMPCGPLQTIQLYALGTGSALQGALSMFFFSIGTIPLMMGLGVLSGSISSGLNKKLLKVSAVLVMALGLMIVNKGITLQEKAIVADGISQTQEAPMLPVAIGGYQMITTGVNEEGYALNHFILEKGKGVKWMLNGNSINECNSEIVVPGLNIHQKLKEGHNLIEFTPQEEGELDFSCGKGILKGKFIIVADINHLPENMEVLPAAVPECCTR